MIKQALDKTYQELLHLQDEKGLWRGELSSSALATAVAISALTIIDQKKNAAQIQSGLAWLKKDQNSDGGWGDSPESVSNLSTTLLVRAAFQLAEEKAETVVSKAEEYITKAAGPTPTERVNTLLELYAPDKTFAVPILANLALAGLVPWEQIPPLPFELSLLPRFLYRFVKMEVVSYALPALIAVGQLLAIKGRGGFLRRLFVWPALRVLTGTQPENGGFLEATPLTAFVSMSLAATGYKEHIVVKRGLGFLQKSQREDGSWPIDTDLALWLTTSAVNSLVISGKYVGSQRELILQALWEHQQKEVHPFTGARPGGWAWTDLPGGVPDCDDTAGALLALHILDPERQAETIKSATNAVEWLLSLQNDDGGWPTFCKGWGRLPFDKSSADITAHVIRALSKWEELAENKINGAIKRGFSFLAQKQRADGSWLPLWFGSQQTSQMVNHVFGTSRVLSAYGTLGRQESAEAIKGAKFLIASQKEDGSWGADKDAPPTIEESAVALDALSHFADEDMQVAFDRGCKHLVQAINEGEIGNPKPIGLYFAKLWYSERLYPIIWSVNVLIKLSVRKD